MTASVNPSFDPATVTFKKQSELKITLKVDQDPRWRSFFIQAPSLGNVRPLLIGNALASVVGSLARGKAEQSVTDGPPEDWLRIRRQHGLPMTLSLDAKLCDLVLKNQAKLIIRVDGKPIKIGLISPYQSSFHGTSPDPSYSAAEVKNEMMSIL